MLELSCSVADVLEFQALPRKTQLLALRVISDLKLKYDIYGNVVFEPNLAYEAIQAGLPLPA